MMLERETNFFSARVRRRASLLKNSTAGLGSGMEMLTCVIASANLISS